MNCAEIQRKFGVDYVAAVKLQHHINLANDLARAVEECEQDRLNAQLSGLETGWEHPGTQTSFRKVVARAAAYFENNK